MSVIPTTTSLSSSPANKTLGLFPSSFAKRRRIIICSGEKVMSSSSPSSSSSDGPTRKPWLLVGLGNPGKIYQGTRHNVGFEMLDAIAEAEGISVSSIRFKAMFGKGSLLLQDMFLMLCSVLLIVVTLWIYWRCPYYACQTTNFYECKWMRSVINHLKGSRDFPRLKIGKMDPVNFVLRPFNKKEKEELDFTFHKGLEAIRILVIEGFNKSATFANTASPSEMLNR